MNSREISMRPSDACDKALFSSSKPMRDSHDISIGYARHSVGRAEPDREARQCRRREFVLRPGFDDRRPCVAVRTCVHPGDAFVGVDDPIFLDALARIKLRFETAMFMRLTLLVSFLGSRNMAIYVRAGLRRLRGGSGACVCSCPPCPSPCVCVCDVPSPCV